MIWEKLKSRRNFVEKDFIELRDSVEELISVIEKYKDMRYNSSLYIDDLKDFLADIKLTLKEKKITDKELKNLNSLGESYFDSRIDNSIYSYYVYDKNNLEKTHKANDEIGSAKKDLEKFFIRSQKKLCII